MSSLMQQIYWKAPYFIKNWMASINAKKLDKWRFGKDFEQVCAELKEHENWSKEQFDDYQSKQLSVMIQHAAANVPYYKKLFAEFNVDPAAIKTPADLTQLPILEKDTVRKNPDCLLDETLGRQSLAAQYTSGTTGTPLKLYRDTRTYSAVVAFYEARWHDVAGMKKRQNSSVSIGGQLVVSPQRTKPPFWVCNNHWKQLYMSSYHLAPDYLGFYVDQLRVFAADYIEGYPSSIYTIARYILDNKLPPVPFKVCFTTAEMLYDYQRQAIKAAFCCDTYNQYGCGELTVFAAQCPQNRMHLSPEMGIVEVLDDNDQPLPPGKTGHLICTSLINKVQPFIRYRLGDIGSLSEEKCSCGSPLPLLGSIEGRNDDVLITRDGRRIGRLDPVFKGTKGIAEAQIIQHDYDKFTIKVVPTKDYKPRDGQDIKHRLLERLGKGEVLVELVDNIERTKTGKFKAVICNLQKK